MAREYASAGRHSQMARPACSQETSLCVACHVDALFSTGATLATRNGYPVVQRQQLQFLSERFYNNPRPFSDGFEQTATWARMISASANVLGRMSHLMDLFRRTDHW